MKKKLLIEVGDDIDLDFLRKNCKTGGLIVDPVPECRAIADGKVLSDMTNRDVLKAIFPNMEMQEPYVETTQSGVIETEEHCRFCCTGSLDWLNAPYKGSEDE